MKRKVILGIVSLIGLSSFVALGSSPEFFKTVLESVQNNSISSAFSFSNHNAKTEMITSLIFEKFDASYVNLEDNPGNGQTGSAGGRRIYPDKKMSPMLIAT